MTWLTENFKEKEFLCKCPDVNCSGKQQGIINLELVRKIQEIRDFLGEKIFVVSGIRCPSWNKDQGGHSDSFHLPKWGLASDLEKERAWSRKKIIELYLAAEKIGFNGLGFYGSFIHVDTGERISRWIRKKGKYIYIFSR